MQAEKTEDETVVEITRGLIEDAESLVHLEVALAKREIKELAIRNGIAAGLLAVALFLAVLAIFVALPVLIVVLSANLVLAAAIWLGAYLLVAIVSGIVGYRMLRLQLPTRTLTTLKETKDWAIHQMTSPGR